MAPYQKFKKLIRKTISTQTTIHVDFLNIQKEKLVLCGWCVKQDVLSENEISVSSAGSEKRSRIYSYQRKDVAQQKGLSSSEQCFGFLLVVNASKSDIDSLVLAHANIKVNLSQSKYVKVSNIYDVILHAGNNLKDAIDFVEAQGISVEKGDAKSKIRIYDEDIENIKDILEPINIHSQDFFNNCVNDYLPEIHKIWNSRIRKSNNSELIKYGVIPSSPTVSIIIPLYGRYDFIQHQISQFKDDPYFHNVELIYVLDDPSLKHEVSVSSVGIYETFGLPFNVVYSEKNLGFAGANNLGVQYANADKILLLNSDIIPVESGWLSTLVEQFDATDEIGILGATLLYEDETIQHCGMELREDSSYPDIWMNHHPYKGIPLSLTQQFELKKVSVTTGACMLMNKSLFEKVEGFNPLYVLGDFEDSDLCLKCIESGLNIYVSGEVKLYHLERLSQDLVDTGDWKFKLTMANGVYQSSRWNDLIKELTS